MARLTENLLAVQNPTDEQRIPICVFYDSEIVGNADRAFTHRD